MAAWGEIPVPVFYILKVSRTKCRQLSQERFLGTIKVLVFRLIGESGSMQKRGNVAAALVLIILGIWFLSVQLSPGLRAFAINRFTWPLIVLGVGALMGFIGLVTWVPGLLIPACIVGGIGGLLYWQNATGNWASWAYAWTLIPGFVGAGVMISGLMRGERRTVVGGGWAIFTSLVLLAIFGSFLGGMALSKYWPVLLILLGFLLLVQSFLRRR